MAKKKEGLAAALRSRIGRVCHFTNPETGEIVEGIYRRGRKVAKTTGLNRVTQAGTPGSETQPFSRTYEFEETVYTVPRHIRITFGAAPHANPEKRP